MGLACDNLLAADVVTSEGELLLACAEENPDLFVGANGVPVPISGLSPCYRLHRVGLRSQQFVSFRERYLRVN